MRQKEGHTIRLRRSSRPIVVMSMPSMLRRDHEHWHHPLVGQCHPHDMPLDWLDDSQQRHRKRRLPRTSSTDLVPITGQSFHRVPKFNERCPPLRSSPSASRGRTAPSRLQASGARISQRDLARQARRRSLATRLADVCPVRPREPLEVLPDTQQCAQPS